MPLQVFSHPTNPNVVAIQTVNNPAGAWFVFDATKGGYYTDSVSNWAAMPNLPVAQPSPRNHVQSIPDSFIHRQPPTPTPPSPPPRPLPPPPKKGIN